MYLLINILLVIIFPLNCVSKENSYEGSNLIQQKEVSSSGEQTIAIIGGGVGGSSAAYFLNRLSTNISIDLFEKNKEMGGRLATQLISGKLYETGGSVIHERNKLANDLVNKLGLFKRKHFSDSKEKLCLYNGIDFEFCSSSWKWITYLKIFLKYGFEVKKLETKVEKIIDSFQKIYRLLDSSVSFESVDDILNAMNPSFKNLTKISYNDYLFDSGFSKTFIKELVQSITLVNYGQDVSIPAFVGCVSFAGTGSHLWSIEDGNKLLAQELALNSNANIMTNTKVNSVTYLSENRFLLNISPKSGQTYNKTFDGVIIATPLTENQIEFFNFPINLPKRKYHRTVSTLVSGRLNKKFRGKDVLNINKSNFFTSLSRVYPVDDSSDQNIPEVYKVFSSTPLTTEQMNDIFEETKVIKINDWLAYPEYDSLSIPLPSFILHPGLYHLNAIEWAASAIEMSLIGGQNVALLTYKGLGGQPSNVFKENITKMSEKTEF